MKKLNEEMKSLKQLELSMPKLDIISSKSIMGGDGYMDVDWDMNAGLLDDATVYPEHQDVDQEEIDTEPIYDIDDDIIEEHVSDDDTIDSPVIVVDPAPIIDEPIFVEEHDSKES